MAPEAPRFGSTPSTARRTRCRPLQGCSTRTRPARSALQVPAEQRGRRPAPPSRARDEPARTCEKVREVQHDAELAVGAERLGPSRHLREHAPLRGRRPAAEQRACQRCGTGRHSRAGPARRAWGCPCASCRARRRRAGLSRTPLPYRGLSPVCLGSFICWNTSRVLAVSSAARDPAGPGDRFELAAPYGLAGAPPWPAMTAVPPLDTRAMGEGPGEPGSCSRATSIGRSGAALRGKRCAGPVGGLR